MDFDDCLDEATNKENKKKKNRKIENERNKEMKNEKKNPCCKKIKTQDSSFAYLNVTASVFIRII